MVSLVCQVFLEILELLLVLDFPEILELPDSTDPLDLLDWTVLRESADWMESLDLGTVDEITVFGILLYSIFLL